MKTTKDDDDGGGSCDCGDDCGYWNGGMRMMVTKTKKRDQK